MEVVFTKRVIATIAQTMSRPQGSETLTAVPHHLARFDPADSAPSPSLGAIGRLPAPFHAAAVGNDRLRRNP